MKGAMEHGSMRITRWLLCDSFFASGRPLLLMALSSHWDFTSLAWRPEPSPTACCLKRQSSSSTKPRCLNLSFYSTTLTEYACLWRTLMWR